jgi:hypothetical protein
MIFEIWFVLATLAISFNLTLGLHYRFKAQEMERD